MRSVVGFVLGLLGSLGILSISMGSIFLGSAFLDLGGATSILTILSWVAFAGAILGIFGSSLCFKKARAGGALLFIGSLTAIVLLGYIISQIVALDIAMSSTIIALLIFSAIPSLLMFIGSICGMSAKK